MCFLIKKPNFVIVEVRFNFVVLVKSSKTYFNLLRHKKYITVLAVNALGRN
jgi:hypothetical protein